jgi:PPOX class probable F420-dependent enzyme
MDLATALDWAAQRKHGVLITLRGDGRPQSSDIVYTVDGGRFLISVTGDRAKTVNMRRDPRVVLHVTEPSSWSYLSFDATAELSPVTTEPGDATSDELVALYEQVSGEPHPDWDEYRRAMVDQRRLVARITPHSVVGMAR